MSLLLIIAVTFFAGMGAGLGTGFAGMSAAAVISPMLITLPFLLMCLLVLYPHTHMEKTKTLILKMVLL